MRKMLRGSGIQARAGIVVLLVVTMLAALLGPSGIQTAAAQDDLAIQTRVVVLHAAPSLGKVEIHINYEEVADEFVYGQQTDWIDFQPGAARVTITADRAGFNYAVFDAIYPAPAGNDYYLIITDAIVLAGAFDLSPVPDGGARVQVIQGSVALPAVNVVANGGDVSFATQLAYPRSSDQAVVPAGSYDIDVTLADTGESALSAPGVALEGNQAYELVIMGQPGDENHPLEIRALSAPTGERAGTPVP